MNEQPTPVVLHEPYFSLPRMLSKILGSVAALAFSAWFVMLALGGVHHDVFPWVPALGYWQTVLVLFLVRCVLPSFPYQLMFASPRRPR